MHQVQITDQLYREAERRAAAGGYSSVDEYIAEVVTQDLSDDGQFDNRFTPERLAAIDKASAEMQAGNYFTTDQANAELGKRRAEWLRNSSR